MADYTNSGFDGFINRRLPGVTTPEYSEDIASLVTSRYSGSGLGSGISQSPDGKLIINWDTGEISASDGVRKRVIVGRIEKSDEYGIKIVDASGNTILSAAGQVQESGIADGAVTVDKLAANSVTSDKIVSKTIVVGDTADALSDRFFTDATTKTNVEGWKSSSDATKIDGGNIYTNSIVVAGLDSGVTERMFTDATTQTNVEGWRHASDVTKIDGGDIYTGSITAGKITVTDLSDISTATGTVNVGNANVKIDGDNTRIIINDGTNDRILIGYQSGGF